MYESMYELCPEFQHADFPAPADEHLCHLARKRWLDAVHSMDNNRFSTVAESLTTCPASQKILDSIFGNSPYLTQTCITYPEFTIELLTNGPAKALEALISWLNSIELSSTETGPLSSGLREAKHKMALAVAMADLANCWTLDAITTALADFAQLSLKLACEFITAKATARGILKPANNRYDPTSGFIVLGMGKLGSRELNYSSDIDLIVLFDPEHMAVNDPSAIQKHCIRMTRELVRIMDERTVQGYVFRTDLRLRPDPGATPLAVSLQAAEIYYESQGQNWERAAMIKARPVAGDIESGERFIKWLRPFIWRKNLDFAAIQDIHSIKRQINAQRGGSILKLEGHNIKLGRGGIREIEFYAQTQQLIWGGRIRELRTPATVDALNALVEYGQVERETADDLIAAYEYLRQTEHRLQMINDEQTQTLPETPEKMAKFAVFMGHESTSAFQETISSHLKSVEDHYARLFADAPALAASGDISGNLVFTGSDSDPDTLDTITRFGFHNAEAVDSAIRGWHHGRYRAMRSTRAREMLTELTPALLTSLGSTPDPDGAFLKFDEFLAGLPAGVQLFSMLHSNPHLLDQLATILGEAPRLAELLSRRPSLFDSVLSTDFMEMPSQLADLKQRINRRLGEAEHFEQALDISRRWVNDRKFQIGLQSLHGTLTPPKAAWTLSDTAEAVINGLFPIVEAEFQAQHGVLPNAEFCVVAFGKLGGHEMTPTSDLDVVFVYDAAENDTHSDGRKALMPPQYFARLGQRYINAINAPTSEGILYEVDMRLRPSGNSGPIACTLDAFLQYQLDSAWTWERMALTRARVVYGNANLKSRIEDIIKQVLIQSSGPDSLKNDIADMRYRMDMKHHTDEPWSIKHFRGGLVDLEFIVQYLVLRHAPDYPNILSPNTWRTIKNLAREQIISAEITETLLEALDLWQALQSRLHLTIETDAPKDGAISMPAALQEKLATLGGASSISDVEAIITRTASDVYAIFNELIGLPVPEEEQT